MNPGFNAFSEVYGWFFHRVIGDRLVINSDVVSCPLSILFRHGQINQFFTNILSIRKKLSDSFKRVVDWNLESDDGHDRF